MHLSRGGVSHVAPKACHPYGRGPRLTCKRLCRATPEEDQLPPYLMLSTPVYSLATRDREGRGNMSLITYSSPVALQPRKFALGLFKPSFSAQTYKDTRFGVLQILQKKHLPLFQILGKTSGRNIDKIQEIRDMGFPVTEKYGLPVLADCAGIMALKPCSDFIDSGDHDVVICDVVGYETLDQSAEPLYTGDLREAGII